MLPQNTTHQIQEPCYQRGNLCQNPSGNRTTLRPTDHRKETQAEVVWTCLPFISSGQNHLARHNERGKKTTTFGKNGEPKENPNRSQSVYQPNSIISNLFFFSFFFLFSRYCGKVKRRIIIHISISLIIQLLSARVSAVLRRVANLMKYRSRHSRSVERSQHFCRPQCQDQRNEIIKKKEEGAERGMACGSP